MSMLLSYLYSQKDVTVPNWYDEDTHIEVCDLIGHHTKLDACKYLVRVGQKRGYISLYDAKRLVDYIKAGGIKYEPVEPANASEESFKVIEKIVQREKDRELSYYRSEMGKIKKGEFPIQVKFRGENDDTKWLSLNGESAMVIAMWLHDNYGIGKYFAPRA